MIEIALKCFNDKLSKSAKKYTYTDLTYLIELARRQLNSSNGFSFCQINSNNQFLGRMLKTVHGQLENVSKAYIEQYNSGALGWKEELEFLKASEFGNQEDVVMIGYIKGKEATSYSLHPKLLRVLLSCFFDDQGELNLVLPENKVLGHKTSYDVPKKNNLEARTSKTVPTLHKDVLLKLNEGLMNRDSFIQNIEELYIKSNADINSLAHCLASIGCLNKLLIQGLIETATKGIYSYSLAYNVSGANHPRLVDRLPVQNLSSDLKEKLYDQVNCVNYDIKSSNFNMLEKLFRDAKLDPSWFIDYLKDPDAKRQGLINKIGCTKRQVKKALQSVTNGAPFVSNSKTAVGKAFDILDQGKTFIKLLPKLKGCMKTFEGLIEDEKNKVFKSRGAWKNATGMTCRFDQDNSFGQVCSFLVMGLEQNFILTLVSKLPDHIKVYTLMHDGFVCSEEIPEDLIDEVKIECDLPYLIFEQQKGF